MVHAKTGILLDDVDALRADPAAFTRFLTAAQTACGTSGAIVYSQTPTTMAPTILRDIWPTSFLADNRLLSPSRLARLCTQLLRFDGQAFHTQHTIKTAPTNHPRFGLVVSNGFGLGHVTRMQAFAEGLKQYGPYAYLSFSAALVNNAYHVASPQYLELDTVDGHAYVHEAALRFFNTVKPTHIIYDGNVLSDGLLSALAQRPDIHLTWIRRGMWGQGTEAKYMASQALADLVIEPGDIADANDTGPSWHERLNYAPAATFLKINPIRPENPAMFSREDALRQLGLDPDKNHALIMLGAADNLTLAQDVIDRLDNLIPVIAHWPMSQAAPPSIPGTIVIERMPIASFYQAFDVLITAAGYNSFHEVLSTDIPTIFIPQEDTGRDQQIARAQHAQDQGWAALHRRNALPDKIIVPPSKAAVDIPWHTDWDLITNAMNIVQGTASDQINLTGATHKFARQMKAMHHRWRLKNKPYDTRFILAFDMPYKTFTRKMPKTAFDGTTVIITNSINPVALRRGGYKYLWVNNGSLWSIRRQYLNWLKIWRPDRIISL